MPNAGDYVRASDIGPDVDIQVFTASGTWTKPTGTTTVWARVVGGGAGCGGIPITAAANGAASAGGGAGGYVEKFYAAGDLNSSETVTVGAAGTAGASGTGTGGNGGSSTFKGLTAGGGNGGGPGVATAGNNSVGGGDGGTATGGDINVTGSAGGTAQVVGGLPLKTNYGGGNPLGPMTRCSGVVNTQTPGIAGSAYGAGASGATNGASQTASVGSAGSAGVVIIVSFF